MNVVEKYHSIAVISVNLSRILNHDIEITSRKLFCGHYLFEAACNMLEETKEVTGSRKSKRLRQ